MKNSGISVVLAALLFMTLLIGCGKSHDPIAGGIDASVAPAAMRQPSDSRSGTGNRVLWGLWKISIAADRETVTVLPDRVGALHFNVVRLLEVTPCTDCLRIQNLQLIPDGLSADVTLIHPFPGLLRYTGFDVRGIFISGSDYTFPASGRKIACGDEVARMLNPDGYTHLFNPTDFPPTKPPILGYIPGHKAPGGDLSATLNPYVAYEQDKPRCVFMPGTVSTRTVLLHFPPGPLEFGYAVDASWFPAGGEVTDPVNDFPPEANCMEAYKIDVQIGPGLELSAGGMAEICVEVFDHQGLETISSVTVEAPELFSGEVPLALSTATSEESWLFSGMITNETGVGDGGYPLLVRVRDTWADQNLGAVDGWQVVTATVGPKKGWARTWGGAESDRGYGVAVDASGSVYVTGYFEDTIDFDPGPGVDEHTSNGGWDVFLSKFDSEGDFEWARTWGGISWDESRGVAADSSGSVYVTGYFGDSVDFDPGPEVDEHSSNGGPDVFLSKFDSEGDFQWARTWGGIGLYDCGYGVAVGSSGGVYVTGEFYDTVDFDPGPGLDEHTSNGYWDAFLSKFDSEGDFQWARTWGGEDCERGNGVAADGSGSVFVTGWFLDTVDFDPGPGVDEHSANNYADVFLSKFDSEGDFQWARTWGGIGYDWDWGLGVAPDGSGSVYVTGLFEGVVDFDPGPGVDEHTSNGGCDVFLSKFDSEGDFQWARTWGGEECERGNGVAVDGSGSVYVTGWFWYTVDFDPGPGVDENTSNGSMDVFLSKFDSEGSFQWARTWGGWWIDQGNGVAADSSGSIYVAGYFHDTVDFNPGPGVDEQTSNGAYDAFLSKFPPDGNW